MRFRTIIVRRFCRRYLNFKKKKNIMSKDSHTLNIPINKNGPTDQSVWAFVSIHYSSADDLSLAHFFFFFHASNFNIEIDNYKFLITMILYQYSNLLVPLHFLEPGQVSYVYCARNNCLRRIDIFLGDIQLRLLFLGHVAIWWVHLLRNPPKVSKCYWTFLVFWSQAITETTRKDLFRFTLIFTYIRWIRICNGQVS